MNVNEFKGLLNYAIETKRDFYISYKDALHLKEYAHELLEVFYSGDPHVFGHCAGITIKIKSIPAHIKKNMHKKKFRQLHRRSGMTLRQIAEFLDEVDDEGKYQRVLNWSSGRTKCPDDCLDLLERRCEHMEKFKLERQK